MENQCSLNDDFDQVINSLEFDLSNTEQSSLLEEVQDPTLQQQQISVFLKPAKAREDQYEGGEFPKSLLCNPYKYDLKIQGEVSEEEITLELVDAETRDEVVSNKPGITVETVEKNSKRERVIRFAINLCSFHFRRRAFRVAVVAQGGKQIFLSTPFRTYARRREHSGQGESPRKKQKISRDFYVSSSVQQFYQGSVNPQVKTSSVLGKRKLESQYNHPQISMLPCILPFNCVKQESDQQIPLGLNPMFTSLTSKEKTTLAIQLMSSLSPMQRETVNLYLSCSSPQQLFSHC